jgi:hypothetical protein
MSANLFSFSDDGFPVLNEKELSKLSQSNDNPKHVICLVGQARMGKSFFLNCFNALLTGESKNIFDSKIGDEHCTKGINVYDSDDYIFIDCQGLKYEDSKGDDKLLLAAYTLSDVIIINGVKTLDNTMFSFIEPISVFENHLKKSKPKTHKPTLVFKVMDYQMDDEPEKKIISQLNKLMKNASDNFQTLRNTLKLLFNKDIHALYTMPPDRNEKKQLKNNNYDYALGSDELNFSNSITHIIEICSKLSDESKVTCSQFIDKCHVLDAEMVLLKENKLFDMGESDLSKLLGEKRCETFCNNIMSELIIDKDGNKVKNPHRTFVDSFKNITTNKINFNDSSVLKRELVESETQKIIEVLNDFDEQFKEADPHFVAPYLNKLCDHMFSSIIPFLESNKEIIDLKVRSINTKRLTDKFIKNHLEKVKTYEQNMEDFKGEFAQLISKFSDLMNLNISGFTHSNMEKNNIYHDPWIKYVKNKKHIDLEICKNIQKINTVNEEYENISNILSKFIGLYEYDANDIFCKMSNLFEHLYSNYGDIIMTNTENLYDTDNAFNKVYDMITSDEYMCSQIQTNTLMTSHKNFTDNFILPFKQKFKDTLMNHDDKLSIITISNIKIDLVNVDIITEFVNITQQTQKENTFWKVCKDMFFPQNTWKSCYDKLTADDFFQSKQILYEYNRKILRIIENDIQIKSISYHESVNIILANPTINFICFSESNVFLHNLVRNHFIPNDGYLLLKNNTSNKMFGEYKLHDIFNMYTHDNNKTLLTHRINIRFINEYTSFRELEMFRFQNKAADYKSQFNIKVISIKKEKDLEDES